MRWPNWELVSRLPNVFRLCLLIGDASLFRGFGGVIQVQVMVQREVLASLTDGYSANEGKLAEAELSCHSDIAVRDSENAEQSYNSDIAGRVSESAELRRRDGGWRGGERRYKEVGRRIQGGIASTFAVAIATPISHFALRTSHLAFRTSHFALYIHSYYHSHRASCI